jgi:hypothetical protein
MKLSDGTYLCPFCLSSSVCEGPHITEEEEQNLKELVHYAKIDHIELALEEISKYEKEKNINLHELAINIKNILWKRDR